MSQILKFPTARSAGYKRDQVQAIAVDLAVQKNIDAGRDMRELLIVSLRHDEAMLARAAALLPLRPRTDLSIMHADQVAKLCRRTRCRPQEFRRDQFTTGPAR